MVQWFIRSTSPSPLQGPQEQPKGQQDTWNPNDERLIRCRKGGFCAFSKFGMTGYHHSHGAALERTAPVDHPLGYTRRVWTLPLKTSPVDIRRSRLFNRKTPLAVLHHSLGQSWCLPSTARNSCNYISTDAPWQDGKNAMLAGFQIFLIEIRKKKSKFDGESWFEPNARMLPRSGHGHIGIKPGTMDGRTPKLGHTKPSMIRLSFWKCWICFVQSILYACDELTWWLKNACPTAKSQDGRWTS